MQGVVFCKKPKKRVTMAWEGMRKCVFCRSAWCKCGNLRRERERVKAGGKRNKSRTYTNKTPRLGIVRVN